ncbi:MAG: preprotein translocase subunit SecA [Acidimicrobiales bacterium]|nr:preprotein translocase subunit SecA [Acidimicrobiales bacterium]
MGVFDRILRTGEGKMLRSLQGLVPDVAALEPELQKLSDDGLRHRTVEFRERLDNGATLDDLLIEAFAVTREAASRVIGQRHYDVQIMGGAALHFGWVAEMRTGEGKTLVSTLPVYLNGLGRKGVHVITVNDYLARRDAEWMGQIYTWLGLTVGLIVPGNNDPAYKRQQYACDVTHGTNNEFGFDYLRDNMAMSLEEKVQRGHNYAIVDEIDSILVDEARTPLIISGRVSDAAALYQRFAQIVRQLRPEVDYEVDEEKRTVAPTEVGINKVEVILGIENLYDAVQTNLVHQLQVALKAKELFHRDKDYIVEGGEVKIVDEFTGRTLEGRRWSEGIHQAVEAKEGVRVKEENQTLATITLQNYFRMYDKLAGMTGTAQTEASELANTYALQVVPIPTHRPMVRDDHNDLIYKSEDAKFDAVVDEIVHNYEVGRPVLAGTASVEHSEKLSKLLTRRGVRHEVLNAKQHFREAEIIAQAGKLGAVTVATNMAGRGVDILLGGNPELLALRDLRAEGIDAATPDEIRRRPITGARLLEEMTEHGVDAERLAALQAEVARANEIAERLEALIEQYAAETKAEGEKVRQLGGLMVIGTERHESRRIDNQLRGRSGRQGDPGESRFYISLEDDLMRLFATGMMERVMGAALPDDVPIESRMVTKAVERAQTTVEQKNGEIRKNVLKYDEVMNEQRKVIYGRRDQILAQGNLREDYLAALANVVDGLVTTYCPSTVPDDWDRHKLLTEANTFWPTQLTVEDIADIVSTDELYDRLAGEATAYYEKREETLSAPLMREIERRVLLSLIDQRWREHLYEMDYLREGIGLRAMGQRDPLTEWQREGYDMFSQMMQSVNEDFVRLIMHADVRIEPQQPAAPQLQPQPFSLGPLAPAGTVQDAPVQDAPVQDAPVQDESSDSEAAAGGLAGTGGEPAEVPVAAKVDPAAVLPQPERPRVTNVSYSSSGNDVDSDNTPATLNAARRSSPKLPGAGTRPAAGAVARSSDKTVGRNEPCPCGSGRKYKNCWGTSSCRLSGATTTSST